MIMSLIYIIKLFYCLLLDRATCVKNIWEIIELCLKYIKFNYLN